MKQDLASFERLSGDQEVSSHHLEDSVEMPTYTHIGCDKTKLGIFKGFRGYTHSLGGLSVANAKDNNCIFPAKVSLQDKRGTDPARYSAGANLSLTRFNNSATFSKHWKEPRLFAIDRGTAKLLESNRDVGPELGFLGSCRNFHAREDAAAYAAEHHGAIFFENASKSGENSTRMAYSTAADNSELVELRRSNNAFNYWDRLPEGETLCEKRRKKLNSFADDSKVQNKKFKHWNSGSPLSTRSETKFDSCHHFGAFSHTKRSSKLWKGLEINSSPADYPSERFIRAKSKYPSNIYCHNSGSKKKYDNGHSEVLPSKEGCFYSPYHDAWVVQWRLAGKRYCKRFKCRSLGYEKAWEMACKLREEKNRFCNTALPTLPASINWMSKEQFSASRFKSVVYDRYIRAWKTPYGSGEGAEGYKIFPAINGLLEAKSLAVRFREDTDGGLLYVFNKCCQRSGQFIKSNKAYKAGEVQPHVTTDSFPDSSSTQDEHSLGADENSARFANIFEDMHGVADKQDLHDDTFPDENFNLASVSAKEEDSKCNSRADMTLCALKLTNPEYFTSPIAGVFFNPTRSAWMAQWYQQGKRKTKAFSTVKYGVNRAKNMAINIRKDVENCGVAKLHRKADVTVRNLDDRSVISSNQRTEKEHQRDICFNSRGRNFCSSNGVNEACPNFQDEFFESALSLPKNVYSESQVETCCFQSCDIDRKDSEHTRASRISSVPFSSEEKSDSAYIDEGGISQYDDSYGPCTSSFGYKALKSACDNTGADKKSERYFNIFIQGLILWKKLKSLAVIVFPDINEPISDKKEEFHRKMHGTGSQTLCGKSADPGMNSNIICRDSKLLDNAALRIQKLLYKFLNHFQSEVQYSQHLQAWVVEYVHSDYIDGAYESNSANPAHQNLFSKDDSTRISDRSFPFAQAEMFNFIKGAEEYGEDASLMGVKKLFQNESLRYLRYFQISDYGGTVPARLQASLFLIRKWICVDESFQLARLLKWLHSRLNIWTSEDPNLESRETTNAVNETPAALQQKLCEDWLSDDPSIFIDENQNSLSSAEPSTGIIGKKNFRNTYGDGVTSMPCSSGIQGVVYRPSSKLWLAKYTLRDSSGKIIKHKTKAFSVAKFGYSEALRRAVNFRYSNEPPMDSTMPSLQSAPSESASVASKYEKSAIKIWETLNLECEPGFSSAMSCPASDFCNALSLQCRPSTETQCTQLQSMENVSIIFKNPSSSSDIVLGSPLLKKIQQSVPDAPDFFQHGLLFPEPGNSVYAFPGNNAPMAAPFNAISYASLVHEEFQCDSRYSLPFAVQSNSTRQNLYSPPLHSNNFPSQRPRPNFQHHSSIFLREGVNSNPAGLIAGNFFAEDPAMHATEDRSHNCNDVNASKCITGCDLSGYWYEDRNEAVSLSMSSMNVLNMDVG